MLWLLACNPAPISLDSSSPSDTGLDVIGTVPDGSCDPVAALIRGNEGDRLTGQVRCASGEDATFALPGGPEGAELTAGGAFTWTPGLDQAGIWEIPVQSDGAGGVDQGVIQVEVLDAWWDGENAPVDPLTYQTEQGLPVFHLTRPADTNESEEVASEVVYRGHTYAIGVKYRGAASLYYPKNSYTLYFPADDEFEDEDLDYPKRRGIVLTSTFDDNSYFRQKLCYDLWNDLDSARHRIETRFAVVYINGAYEGLYVMGDHIDGEYWEDQGYFEDGNLYKSVDHSANFYDSYGGRAKSSLHSGYEKKEGEPRDDFSDLDDLVSFVIGADDATFEAELPQRIVVEQFMDWWVLVRFTEADDSAGKNAYLYNDPAAPMWRFAPWDFNHSLGQTWQSDRQSVYSDTEFTDTNNLFRRMLEIPSLRRTLIARYQAALEGPYSEDAMQARIDGYVAAMWPAAERDWQKWGDEYRNYDGWSWRNNWTTPEEEVEYVRGWTEERVRIMREWYP